MTIQCSIMTVQFSFTVGLLTPLLDSNANASTHSVWYNKPKVGVLVS